MLHYIFQTIAFQLFFLIIYDVFLKKETFFNWNRIYLLLTAMASIILPFVKLESMRAIVPQDFVIRLPEVIIGDVAPIPQAIPVEAATQAINTAQFVWSWDYLLYLGMIVATIILLFKIIKISRLIQKNPKRWYGDLLVVHLMKSNSAFSFFHYVFIGEYVRAEERDAILAHESVHVHQKHTLDLMLFEVFRIVFWFNPLVYMYQNRMTILHEYIADAKAVKKGDKAQYYQNLLSQVFHTQQISFTNTFYKQSLIKKRIVMLSKSKSNRIRLLRYALIIPMVFGMMMYTSSYGQVKQDINKSGEETIGQQYTLKELTEKYYQELLDSNKNKNNGKWNFDNFLPSTEQYAYTLDEVARIQAYLKYISGKVMENKRKNGTLTQKDVNEFEKGLNKYNTYQDYLEYQKTDEAKSIWESNTRDGILRMVVNDMKNLTPEEQKKQEEKINLIERDDFFHSLLITDGKTTTRMEFHSIDGKEIPGPTKNKESDDMKSYENEVPFSVIDEVPTFTECTSLENVEEIKTCTSNKIAEFVNINFNTNLSKDLGLKGRQRINVLFKIGKDGIIIDVQARAPHPDLEAEAIRVIKSLPQMISGKQKGKNVVVPYSLPILFEVNE